MQYITWKKNASENSIWNIVFRFLRGLVGGGFSKVVATFSHVGRFFNLFMATTEDVSNANFFKFVIITGRELCSGVKYILVTIVTGSLWLVRRYRWGQVNLKTISTIPSH